MEKEKKFYFPNILYKSQDINTKNTVANVLKKENVKFLFLSGDKGTGKTNLAFNISKNILHDSNYSFKYVIYNGCIKNKKKIKRYQIINYETFISNILMCFDDSLCMTGLENIEIKEDIVKKYLNDGVHNTIFILDDFDNIKNDDAEKIISFLETLDTSNVIYSIFTFNRINNCNNLTLPHLFYEIKVDNIYRKNFNKILPQYFSDQTWHKNQNLINFYSYVYNENCGNLHFLEEIKFEKDINEKIKCLTKSEIKKGKLKELINDYRKKNISLAKEIRKLPDEIKNCLHLISFFDSSVSYEILEKLLEKINIWNFQKKINQYNRFVFIVDEEKKYCSLEKNVKKILEDERNKNPEKYKHLIETWILFYKEFTEKLGKGFDDFSSLEIIDNEFDNISDVLDYCYKEKLWSYYYDISNQIKYYCYLKNKDIVEYHIKRIIAAKELNDKYKIFDSICYFCDIACKTRIQDKYVPIKYFDELEKMIDAKEINYSERRLLKYRYTDALRYYSNGKLELANSKFEICERKLLYNILQNENVVDAKRDFVTTVKWHYMCFFDFLVISINNKHFITNEQKEEFVQINNKVEKALVYAKDSEINFTRAIVYLLIYQIKFILMLHEENIEIDNSFNLKKIITNLFSLLELKENVINKDSGYKYAFTELKSILMKNNDIERIVMKNKKLKDSFNEGSMNIK